MKANRGALLGAIVLAGAVLGAAVAAPYGSSPRSPSPAIKWARLSSDLAQVLRAERAHGRGLAVAGAEGLAVVGARVRVVVVVRTSRRDVASAVRSAGGEVEAGHANLVQALVKPAALGRLSRAAAVSYVRAPHRPVAAHPALVPG